MALSKEEKQILQEIAGTLSARIESGQNVASVIAAANRDIKTKLPLKHDNNIIISSIILALQGIENDDVIYGFLQKLWDEQSKPLIAGILETIREYRVSDPEGNIRISAVGLSRLKDVFGRVLKDKDDETINVIDQLSKNMKEKKGVRAAINIAKNDLKKKHISEDESVLVDVIIMALMHMKHSKGRCYVMRHMLRYNQPLFKKVFIHIRACQDTDLYNLAISQHIDLSGLKTELLTVENEMKTEKDV